MALAALALLALAGAAAASGQHHGKGKRGGKHHAKGGHERARHATRGFVRDEHHGKRGKVVLCHNGHTIRIAFPALKAHLRHGDDGAGCGHDTTRPAPSPGSKSTTLTVVEHVVNDNGGTKSASDFTLTITGVTADGGNTLTGSNAGVTKTIVAPGAYGVTETPVAGYAPSMSPGCSGTIAAGEHKLCVVTNDDVAATLTVLTPVVNDDGGTNGPGDLVATIHGLIAQGGNSFAGSAAGVTKTLGAVGAYTVTVAPVAGYGQASSTDCSGTITLGEHKTCVITSNDVPAP